MVRFFPMALHCLTAARISVAALSVFWLLVLAAVAAGAGPHLVADARTGAVLTQSRATDRWFPASLTKLMTTYTVLREIRRGAITLRSPVRISAKASNEPPSKMGFPWKTILTVETALKILMVKSANDVATALGESVGGSEAAFAGMMNGYAREIGMVDSNWVNAHGLHDPNQYSSARDLALLAIRLKTEFAEQSGLFDIHAIKVGNRRLKNHNALLRRFAGTTGMKTGFICAGGVSIVASARINARELVAVVLGHRSARERNVRAAELLTAASRRVRAHGLPNIYEWPASDVPVAPVDISDAVCGRGDGTLDQLEREDPAINYFPIQRPTLKERQALYFTDPVNAPEPVALALGNATGPDPFGLLIEKPPIGLAESGEVTMQGRGELEDGTIVAVPEQNPLQPQAAEGRVPADAKEGQPATLSVTGKVVLGGVASAIPVRPPVSIPNQEADSVSNVTASDQGN